MCICIYIIYIYIYIYIYTYIIYAFTSVFLSFMDTLNKKHELRITGEHALTKELENPKATVQGGCSIKKLWTCDIIKP